ncbi:family 20 glycosylhydrolase [Lonepinella sp. MS14436]|uniref:family 20 glycosylhydrolase n=1 Tax=Lonepinella sp. MS14436 TaxID=3003619 RepID=UPI0036D8EEC7
MSSIFAQTNEIIIPSKKESGLVLDISRHFYPVDSIKKFIDILHQSKATFLHLHFSDDQNYAIESNILGQTTETAVKKDGVFINPITNKPFLTYSQLDDLIHYAKDKGIELVPELDSPGHMQAILTLLEHKNGKDYTQSLKSKHANNEIDITNPESIHFIKSLITEVCWIFGDSSHHFHIGGDEFGYDDEDSHEFITYVNNLSSFLTEKGLITRLWNDGLIKKDLPALNHSVQITYWSYDGDTQDVNDARYRREIRASMPDLINNGFQVLNYNSYYLYFVPNHKANLVENSQFATQDIKQNWKLGIWDGKNTQNSIQDSRLILGAAVSVWGEDIGSTKTEHIQEATSPLIKAMKDKLSKETQNY